MKTVTNSRLIFLLLCFQAIGVLILSLGTRSGIDLSGQTTRFLYGILVLFTLAVIRLFFLYQKADVRKRAGEKKFETLLEAAPDATIITNTQGVITMANRQAEKMFGYTKQELTGMEVEWLMPGEYRDQHTHLRSGYAQKPVSRPMGHGNMELTAMRKDGRHVPVEISLSPIETGDGHFVMASVRDISGRKEANERTEQLLTMVNEAREAIFVTDRNMVIQTWNKGAEKLYGFDRQEAIGKNALAMLRSEITETEYAGMIEEITRKDHWVAELKMSRKNGEAVFVHSSFSVIRDAAGEMKGFISVSYDISKERDIQDKLNYLASVSENITEAVFSTTIQDRCIISWNQGAEKLFGLKKEEVIGFTADELGIVKLMPAEVSEVKSALMSEGSWQSEKEMFRKDGTAFSAWVKASALPHINGQLKSFIFFVQDITVKKQLEERLKRDKEVLEKEVRLRTSEIRASEERYRQTLDNMLEGVQIIGFDGTYKYINRAAASQAHTTPEELAGCRMTEKFPGIEHTEVYGLILKCMEDRQPVQMENEFLLPDGDRIWVELSIQPVPEGVFILSVDISERRKAEERVGAEQQKLDAIAASSPGLIYSFHLSPEGAFSFLYASRALEEIFGYGVEYMDKDVSVIMNATVTEDRQAFMDSILESARSLSPWNMEFRYHHPVKGLIWLEGNSVPSRAADGGVTWHGVVMDVTGRKQAEAAIRESEEKYRSVVDNAFDGVLFFTPDGTITDCNASACMVMGYERDEFIGMNVTALYDPEDLRIRPLQIDAVVKGEIIFDHRSLHRKDGSILEIELVTRALPDGRLIAMGRDITAQNMALSQQNLLSSIVNYSNDAIVSTDFEGRIISWNKGAEKIFGYTEKQVKGTDFSRRFMMRDPHTGTLMLDSLKEGHRLENREAFCLLDEGREIILSVTASPLIVNGELRGSSLIIRDITRQKEDENQIRLSNLRYETVAKATSDAIWDFDYSTYKTFIAGTGYHDLFGYPIVNDFLPPGFWENCLHPDDKDRVLAEMDRAKENKALVQSQIEYRFRKADGSWACLSDRFFILRDAAGKPVRMMGAKQDITLRKQAEDELKKKMIENEILLERLSVILNTLPASVALLNEQGMVVEVNEAWKKFADENGFTDTDYGVNNSYLTISTQSFGNKEAHGKAISQGISAVLQGNAPLFEFEYPWHLPGLPRWFRIVVTPLRGQEFTGAVVMNIDISDIRRLEKERIESKIEEQKRITEAMIKGQEKERNAIGIELHDNVNQILVGTKVLLTVVRDDPDRCGELIPTCIDHIAMAVQENRKIAHELVTPNLSEETLVQQVTKLSQTMLQNAGLKTYINHQSFREDRLSKEMKLALYRIMQEQCTNIIKYADAEQVIISLATKSEMFYMRVADDGRGMDLRKVTHGIGLKNISSRLGVFGGTINVDTAPGQGFALEIEIPLTPVPEPSEAG